MGTRRQKIQGKLAFTVEGRDEAPTLTDEGTEVSMAKRTPERPVSPDHLMEEVCERGNLTKALKRVKANKGSPGIDGMTVDELPHYLKEHWTKIEAQLLAGTYRPKPVRRVEIPKPEGGMRSLGIPTVVDRFIQQAVLQVLQKRWDETFSDHSYGFRPGRSAHQAVTQAQTYITEGYGYVVDIDLEKFFDRVNHDMLMGRIAKRIADKRVLALIRAFLHAGVMEDGLTTPTDEGTPQGGPLSPLLSNLFLDDLDRELERRGHRFVRYADDCNIYVRTERAGHRVMESISRFITKKLKLRVNGEKSAVARPSERTFLGFSVTGGKRPRRRIAPKALKRLKHRVRRLTRRTRGIRIEKMVEQLSRYLIGWATYYGFCETPAVLTRLNSWIRRRLRSAIWKQWKRGRTRFTELRRRGVSRNLAAQTAGTAHGPWRISRSPALSFALPDAYFTSLGLPALVTRQMT
jgi:RNA-directed DNA polymerase